MGFFRRKWKPEKEDEEERLEMMRKYRRKVKGAEPEFKEAEARRIAREKEIADKEAAIKDQREQWRTEQREKLAGIGRGIKVKVGKGIEARKEAQLTPAQIREVKFLGAKEKARALGRMAGRPKGRYPVRRQRGRQYLPPPSPISIERPTAPQIGKAVRSYTRYDPQTGRHIRVGGYSRRYVSRLETTPTSPVQPRRGGVFGGASTFGTDIFGTSPAEPAESQQPRKKSNIIVDNTLGW